jgi:energy-coupling factor transporter transmembrane protein EcfT
LTLRLSFAVGLITALVLPFIVTGEWVTAARLGLRALSAATIALTFTSDLSGPGLATALGTLRAPASLVEVIEGLALQLDSLRNVARRVVLARKLRGARGLKGSATVLPELLVRSAERAERLELARRLRGYERRQRDPLTLKDLLPASFALLGALLLHAIAFWS